ncbi:MAG TPA: VWA domain-containing protein [Polyangia bacterium]|nr:VWA domain-containing protein [Polyangia bacterium]
MPSAPGNQEVVVKIETRSRRLVVVLVTLWSAHAAGADPPASLHAPARATAGGTVDVKWTGPGAYLDVIVVVPAGSPDNTVGIGLPRYVGGSKDAHLRPAVVTLPEEPGEYELRYGSGGKLLARTRITVVAATATVKAPATATAGSRITVSWTGPNNQFDSIGIVKAGATDKDRPVSGNFTFNHSQTTLNAPEQAGDYEVRYLTGLGHATLARTKLTVTGASASVTAPASVAADDQFKVTWTGPAGEFDRIVLAQKGSPDRKSIDSDFTSKGSPLGFRAPASTGDYELRYQTGGSGSVLARTTLKVTPGKAAPGLVRVTHSSSGAGAGAGPGPGAVEIILDTSGSMLQRIGGQRRIEIARRTLTKLTGETIPAGTPFALRVIGRGSDSCQSELDIPFAPLDRAAARLKLAGLQAKNNARTPIGAALEKVADDLGPARGERVVILVTDGEETCGGSPAHTIQKLVASGVDVRVNIVGFAVEDDKLAATFAAWSRAGGGNYFDARDAKSLSAAFTQAVRPAFELTDAQKNVVAKGLVGGDPVRVLPGTYAVTLKGHPGPPRSVTVRPRETSTVSY